MECRNWGFCVRPPRKLLPILVLLALAPPGWTQTFYGSVVGTVRDASGGIVPGAAVVLTNTGTSEKRATDTDATGSYQFVNLVPGVYRVDIQGSGFKHLTRDGIQVEVQAAVRIDADLQVGDVGQVVEVTSATPLLQTESASLGQVVESRTIQEMPLNGRNVLNLVALTPGVVPQGSSMKNPTNSGVAAWGNYQIGGGMGNQSASFLDGAPLNLTYVNIVSLVPTQDAVQEFRVQTNNLGSEFGRFGGGVVNMTTKSGTNSIHGGASEFLRNKVLNANTFFNNRSGLATPAFTQNQYGANVGGPAIKNKTFFFASFEGYNLRQGNSVLRSVPTNEMRAGDFSGLTTNKGVQIPIYDPQTTCGILGNPACAAGQTYTRSPFPENRIPAARLDPTAKVLANVWGAPDLPGAQFTHVNNFAVNSPTGGDSTQFNFRGDHNISAKQRIFGRLTRWTTTDVPNDPYGTGVGSNTDFQTYQAVLADTYSFSANKVGDIRVAFLRFKYNGIPLSTGTDLTKYAWPASLNGQVAYRQIPYPCVQAFTDFCQEVTEISRNNNYSISPSFTWITGRHTLKFGADLRRNQGNYAKSNGASGVFNFDSVFTSVNPFAPNGTGYGFASFMLGLGTTAPVSTLVGVPNGISTPSLVAAQVYYQGYYVADTFQVSNKLTLNLGFRWDIPGPYTERYDRETVWQPGVPNPLAQATGLPLVGKLGLVNSADRSQRGENDSHWKLFAPRVGFAYRFDSKTVARGGYALVYLPNDINYRMSPFSSPINSITTPWVPTLDGGLTPASTLSNPFPTGVLLPPGHNPAFQSLLYGQSIQSPVPNEPTAYTEQWNFGIQRELAPGTALEVSYVGNRGVHLLAALQEVDQLPDQYLSMGARLQDQVPNPFAGLISSGTLTAATVARGQLLRPYPQYTGVQVVGPANRNSIYHAMQAKLEKRIHTGGAVLVSYTWAKMISDTDTLTTWLESGAPGTLQDNNNLRLERSLLTNDVPQRLVASYVLELPVGKGKALWGSASGVAGKLVSGWGLDGIATFQKGSPLPMTTAVNLTNSFGGGSRPNVVYGCDPSTPGSAEARLGQWFNTACFSQPAAFTFGNASRTDPKLRADGINNWDVSVFKDTTIREQIKLQFRTELFNLLNHPQFGYPGLAFGNAQYGVVSSQANNPRLIQLAMRLLF